MLVTLGIQRVYQKSPTGCFNSLSSAGTPWVEGRLNLFLLGYPVETSAEERGFSPLGGRFQIKMNGCYIHTYIHTLLACPHGAFQSQFYITKL